MVRFLNVDNIIKKKKVQASKIKTILDSCRIVESSNTIDGLCKGHSENYYLEDITVYNDVFFGKKNNIYILKEMDHANPDLLCFKQAEDQQLLKTVKQKLGDVSTSYVIKQFDDDSFMKFFKYFYVPLDMILTEYAVSRNLNVPQDICFYFKGGNIFRILLKDITRLMTSHKFYEDLLKRSDADFQIYINPSIRDYERVFEEVSVLVLYNLYLLKKSIFKHNLFDFVKFDDSFINTLKKELLENDIYDVEDIQLSRYQKKKDFTLYPLDFGDEKVAVFQEHNSLLSNVTSSKECNSFFVSLNKTLDFNRKDQFRSSFDLFRMKRNIRISVLFKNGLKRYISIPCEIIDISMPRKDDYSLKEFGKNIDTYISRYTTQLSTSFFAPTVEYMIKDLDDVLFKQSVFPWSDPKVSKRIIRYFLSLFLFRILSAKDKNSLINVIIEYKKDLNSIKDGLRCFLDKSNCDIKILPIDIHDKWLMISNNINKLKTRQEKAEQLKNFQSFNNMILNDLIIPFSKDIEKLIANSDKITERKIQRIFQRLTSEKVTDHLGGKR